PVAVLALHVHEVGRGLLGGESARLLVPDNVARQAVGARVALILGQGRERARVLLGGVHLVLGFVAAAAVLLAEEVVPRQRSGGGLGRRRRGVDVREPA